MPFTFLIYQFMRLSIYTNNLHQSTHVLALTFEFWFTTRTTVIPFPSSKDWSISDIINNIILQEEFAQIDSRIDDIFVHRYLITNAFISEKFIQLITVGIVCVYMMII